MITLIDNYDSFTYNLYQLVGTLTSEPVQVIKNDDLTAAEVMAQHPSALIFSPGPGRPEKAGHMSAILDAAIGQVPILGVCLGHQAIAQAYGGDVIKAPELVHGKPATMTVTNGGRLFEQVPVHFEGARYHSLIVDRKTLPTALTVTATSDQEVMALSDDARQVFGVQFHPESIMTTPAAGRQLMTNFLTLVGAPLVSGKA